MGFGGSVSAMISSLRNNKMLLRERNNIYDYRKKYKRAAEKLHITFKEATPEQLAEIRARIKKENRMSTITFVVVLLMVITFSAWLVTYLTHEREDKIQSNQIKEEKAKLEKYNFFIADGDSMFTERKWNNAIFQYTRAEELYPLEFDIQYRIALAYTYKCQHTNEECFKADSLVNRLNDIFPKNEDVIKLNKVLRTHLND